MDILHLIDRLEKELSQGQRLPLTDTVMVNEQRLWDIIDSMRISVPEEVQRAQQVERERERILAQVREKGRRIVDLARERAEEMTSNHELIQAAQGEAAEIVSQARSEAREFQDEADSYALDVLTRLEGQLKDLLQTVQNGAKLLSGQEEGVVDPEDEV